MLIEMVKQQIKNHQLIILLIINLKDPLRLLNYEALEYFAEASYSKCEVVKSSEGKRKPAVTPNCGREALKLRPMNILCSL